jgi:acyl-CoA dehydrogenase
MPDRAFLGWPFFDDAHRRMAEELDTWVSRDIAPLEEAEHAEEELHATCRGLVAKLGGGGWLRYCVPAAYGGVRDTLDVRSLCLTRETLARTSGLADFAFAMQGLGSASISLFGKIGRAHV